jgi:hypothetical protein
MKNYILKIGFFALILTAAISTFSQTTNVYVDLNIIWRDTEYDPGPPPSDTYDTYAVIETNEPSYSDPVWLQDDAYPPDEYNFGSVLFTDVPYPDPMPQGFYYRIVLLVIRSDDVERSGYTDWMTFSELDSSDYNPDPVKANDF